MEHKGGGPGITFWDNKIALLIFDDRTESALFILRKSGSWSPWYSPPPRLYMYRPSFANPVLWSESGGQIDQSYFLRTRLTSLHWEDYITTVIIRKKEGRWCLMEKQKTWAVVVPCPGLRSSSDRDPRTGGGEVKSSPLDCSIALKLWLKLASLWLTEEACRLNDGCWLPPTSNCSGEAFWELIAGDSRLEDFLDSDLDTDLDSAGTIPCLSPVPISNTVA